MEFKYRKSALEGERKYTLQDDGLVIEDLKTNKTQTLLYTSIASVNLGFEAKRNMPDIYQCTIKTKKGNTVLLQNQHYKGMAQFEDRSLGYVPFVSVLHQAIASNNQQVTYSSGMSSGKYYFYLIVSIAVMLLFSGISLVALVPYGIITILVLVYLFFRLKKYFSVNKPGAYEPNDIPQKLLPA